MSTMLKNILVFVFLLVIIPAYSQMFNGGMEVGVSASQVDGDCKSGYHKLGFTGGMYAELFLKSKLYLVSGVYLVQKGAHSSPKEVYSKLQINEAEIPVLIRYKYSDKLQFDAGLGFAYIYNAYYDSGSFLDFDQLEISKWDYTMNLAIKIKVSQKVNMNLVNSYGILPITRPIRLDCWQQSAFLSWLYPAGYCDCWWTNTVRVSFEYKLF